MFSVEMKWVCDNYIVDFILIIGGIGFLLRDCMLEVIMEIGERSVLGILEVMRVYSL